MLMSRRPESWLPSGRPRVFAFRFDRAPRLWLRVLSVTPGTSVLAPRRLLAHPAVRVTVSRPPELVRLGLMNLLTRVSARTSRVGARSS
jgi:hypothetical protein